jgi:hypothetical protein
MAIFLKQIKIILSYTSDLMGEVTGILAILFIKIKIKIT